MKILPVLAALALLLTSSPAFPQQDEDVGHPKNEAWSEPPESDPADPLTADPLNDPGASVYPGDRLPGFEAHGSLGRDVGRADLLGHWSAIVFDPVPRALVTVDALRDSLASMHVHLYGVTQADSSAERVFATSRHLALVLLADPAGTVARRFGMYDDDLELIQQGLIVVDPGGVVRMTFHGPALHAEEVLQMIRHVVRGA